MQTTEYTDDSIISVDMHEAFLKLVNVRVPNDTKTHSTMISFLKTDVEVSEEISLNKFSDLISSVGGNLGLFVGFSFLSALLSLVEWAQNIPLKYYR